MFLRCLLGLVVVFASLFGDGGYKFEGKHFVGSYLRCDPDAISNVHLLLEAMDKAVGSSGATVLNKIHYIFPPNGLTVVYLLSESHASLHTYPEFGACFIDLFTCGDHCSAENFDASLRTYLQPQEVNCRHFYRNEQTEEIYNARD